MAGMVDYDSLKAFKEQHPSAKVAAEIARVARMALDLAQRWRR